MSNLYATVNGNGPVVVLLHGYMSDRHYWDKLAAQLTAEYTVVAVDLQGFGRSPKPKDPAQYSFEQQALSLERTLAELGVKRPFILIGHSMGALVAATYAYLRSDHICHLILSNMSIFLDPTETRQQLSSTSRLYQTLLYKPQGRLLWPVIKTSLPLLKKGYRELRNMTKYHSHASRQGALSAIENTDAKVLLERLTVPTDLIIGLKDRAMYQKNITGITLPKNVILHYVPTGHHTPVQHPEFLVKLL